MESVKGDTMISFDLGFSIINTSCFVLFLSQYHVRYLQLLLGRNAVFLRLLRSLKFFWLSQILLFILLQIFLIPTPQIQNQGQPN